MEIRPVTLDEHTEFVRCFSRALAFQQTDEQVELGRRNFVPDRSLGVFDEGRVVGTTYARLFEVTIPGGLQLPVAGVTAVSVASTHRRRGLLRRLMERQLAETRERGEPLAILIASESVIYGRFGYGPSSALTDVEIDTRDGVFLDAVPDGGRIVLVDEETADKVFPDVYDRYRRAQPGEIERGPDWWDWWRLDRKPGAENLAVYESGGRTDGYARYALKMKWEAGLPQYSLELRELTTVTVKARAALWRFLLDVDLVRTVKAPPLPPDEPLRWLLANPRGMRVTRYGDLLWTRVLDVEAALGARRYTVETELVIEVDDHMLPEVGGRYALDASPDGATCTRTDRAADLSMPVRDLGAIYFGGVAPSELARVGRISERTDGALRRADAAFLAQPRPFNSTWF